MTREEAIERFNGIINAMSISIAQSKFYPSKAELDELCDMAIEALRADTARGTYQCFHCGSYSVVWGADFDFADYGYEGEGIVHSCHCANCGAEIEYRIPIGDDDD